MSWRFHSAAIDEPGAESLFLALERHGDLFDRSEDVIVARAPGRLDLMGGIADYSGSLVLELPLAVATFVAMQRWDERIIEIVTTSVDVESAEIDSHVRIPVSDLLGDYESVRSRFARDPRRHWIAYALGALTVLANERGARFEHGLRVLVASDVPSGKGVSSSAALEVAAMRALACVLDLRLEGRELALLAQKVENLVAGAPCGVMDQITSACGTKDALVAMLCQPAELEAPVRLPKGLAVFGIDSGVRHEVKGADYGSVRTGAFMGYRILAALEGFRCERVDAGRVVIEDRRWRGYLANVTPDEWAILEEKVPETILGRDFLAAYDGITDAVTRVEPDRRYAVRIPTRHPIHENARVAEFRTLLASNPLTPAGCEGLGARMFASHASYGACGLGSSGTDRLVEMVRALPASCGVLGAKITGGGSGGTVAVLARSEAADVVRNLARDYATETGRGGTVLEGSSNGALAVPVVSMRV